MKTLKGSDINLNPQVDKNGIRIQVPKYLHVVLLSLEQQRKQDKR